MRPIPKTLTVDPKVNLIGLVCGGVAMLPWQPGSFDAFMLFARAVLSVVCWAILAVPLIMLRCSGYRLQRRQAGDLQN